MFDLLQNMDPLLRIFWYIAAPVSAIFLVQTILTFAGLDAHDAEVPDFDGDLDVEGPFQLFSLRNLINFLLGFSWSGIALFNVIPNKAILIIVSFLIGTAMLAMFFLMMRQIYKLSENNSFTVSKTLSKTGTVYIAIPEAKSNSGKVQISVNGAVHELEAVTLGERIATGTIIRVVDIIDQKILVVEKL